VLPLVYPLSGILYSWARVDKVMSHPEKFFFRGLMLAGVSGMKMGAESCVSSPCDRSFPDNDSSWWPAFRPVDALINIVFFRV